eukprot:NODE_1478_length_1518_cov_25.991831_g1336_i0.p1 GENE.NODE_1478_length_1518_cov_25.991831_g1336_i0~~NODE_1478_length_1518_cov_25.991831_g1336_i0.p1  ORF type:complete len:385 (-),score=66.71 NODE_1478_length_1518_cov_25.991831_g1336_i0:219-1373(-)
MPIGGLSRRTVPGCVKEIQCEIFESETTTDDSLYEVFACSPSKMRSFDAILRADIVDVDALKQAAWHGIPARLRATCWMILARYMPTNRSRRDRDMARKRKDYWDYVKQYYNTDACIREDGAISNPNSSSVAAEEITTRRQIHIDVPRTNPKMALFHSKAIRLSLERILNVWAHRHPGSGYVQGINDLVTPFIIVFVSQQIEGVASSTNQQEVNEKLAGASPGVLDEIEADTYWCFAAMLTSIHHLFTFGQPEVLEMVHKCSTVVARVDAPLHSHLCAHGLDFIQFAYRWMNCLLLRELPVTLSVRLWDTYLAEGDAFPVLHVYVCAALLMHWSEKLRRCDFTELMLMLQALPTQELSGVDFDTLLSKAHLMRELYESSPSHLR